MASLRYFNIFATISPYHHSAELFPLHFQLQRYGDFLTHFEITSIIFKKKSFSSEKTQKRRGTKCPLPLSLPKTMLRFFILWHPDSWWWSSGKPYDQPTDSDADSGYRKKPENGPFDWASYYVFTGFSGDFSEIFTSTKLPQGSWQDHQMSHAKSPQTPYFPDWTSSLLLKTAPLAAHPHRKG